MLRIRVDQQQSLEQATLDQAAEQLTREIVKIAGSFAGSPMLDESSALVCSRSAIGVCRDVGIFQLKNIRAIAVTMMFMPERLANNSVAASVLAQRSLSEDWRIDILYEMGVLDGPPKRVGW